jgi:hypothetical protein
MTQWRVDAAGAVNTDAETAFIINVFGGDERGDRALNAYGFRPPRTRRAAGNRA